jgi:hypothetical protein
MNEGDLTWLGVVVTAVGSLLVAVVGAISLVWRRRQDRKDQVEDKVTDAAIAVQPKVIDGWEEVRKARAEATRYYNLYRVFEELYYTVASAFRKLAKSVRDRHPDEEFDKDVVEALALKPPETNVK